VAVPALGDRRSVREARLEGRQRCPRPIEEEPRGVVGKDRLEVAERLKAEDGEQALELIRALQPDLVLLDIGLPKMSGIEVARVVRSNPKTRGIPLVAVTSAPLAPTIVAGCDCYFAKPFDVFALVEKLKELFEPRTGHDVAA
jgi:CheY-like chemotaxis protein